MNINKTFCFWSFNLNPLNDPTLDLPFSKFLNFNIHLTFHLSTPLHKHPNTHSSSSKSTQNEHTQTGCSTLMASTCIQPVVLCEWNSHILHSFQLPSRNNVSHFMLHHSLGFRTKQKYGAFGDRFTFMQSLVLIQCLVNTMVAFVFKSRGKSNDNVPLQMYSFCSISYVLAMLFSNLALEYINYPTQVLGKSCKPIPILISGVLFAHKSYPIRKYLYILMIVFGMAVFLYKEKPGKSHGGFSLGMGEGLLVSGIWMGGVFIGRGRVYF